MVSQFFQKIRESKVDLTGVLTVGISSVATAGLILGLRSLGWLQAPELKAYDQMMQLRQDTGIDSRFLIVGVTEEDNKKYGVPMSDRDLAKLFQQLQKSQPRVIGLDIFRNLPQPPGQSDLVKELKAPNIVAITKLGSGTREDPTIPPPPAIAEDQYGFNDVVTDSDNVIRRNLMFADTYDGGTLQSFSFKIALLYLDKDGVPLPRNSAANEDYIEWGKALFKPLEPRSGAYQNNDAQGYQLLLNYRKRGQIAPRVSISDVLEGKVPPEMIRDKIVMIGSVATSSKDFFFTPYSSAERIDPKMPGVEIHAQMAGEIMDAVLGHRPLFWFWPEWAEILWIVGWAIVGGVGVWSLRNPLVLGVGSLVLMGAVTGSGFVAFLNQGWIPVVSPALACALTGVAVVAIRAQQAQRQQQMTMALLGQSTSPQIAEALWNSRDLLIKDGKLPGQKLTATMLFTDIRNFSTISEQMPPEDLLNWLNEYLAVMTREVQLHQGIVNKFTGDGLIAVFGVPVARASWAEIAEDAANAVDCALTMGENLQLLNQDWQQRGLPCIQIRVGIFTGPIVAGSLGGKERSEYGIIGDSVNTASRLESVEKERQGSLCRILIAQQTLDYVQGRFEVENWGGLALKGKQQMVDVYRVLGRVAQPLEGGDISPEEHSLSKTDVNSNNLNPK